VNVGLCSTQMKGLHQPNTSIFRSHQNCCGPLAELYWLTDCWTSESCWYTTYPPHVNYAATLLHKTISMKITIFHRGIFW